MKKTLRIGIVMAMFVILAGACSGPQVTGPLTGKELRALKGAEALNKVSIVMYHEQFPAPQARALYEKLLDLGMKDHLIEPGLGIGGERMIMYRAERQAQAEWLKAHVWELKDFGLMLEKSATDIYINLW
jgi:hypothetical protein